MGCWGVEVEGWEVGVWVLRVESFGFRVRGWGITEQ